MLSAKTVDSLRRAAERLADDLASDEPEGEARTLASIAHTLQTGREQMKHRLAFVARTRMEAVEGLRTFAAGTHGGNLYTGVRDVGSDHPEAVALAEALVAHRAWDKLARAWTAGLDVPWDRSQSPTAPPRVSLPGYAFERRRYWVGDVAGESPERTAPSSVSRRRVAVIGAGPAGLACAKALCEVGLEPVVLERSSRCGGIWSHPKSRWGGAYSSTRLQTSKYTSLFSDFPPPEDMSIFPTGEEVSRYLEAYAAHFAVAERIRYGTTVVEVARSGEDWEVTVETDRGRATERFDAVAVCVGSFWSPVVPDMPGLDTFSGEKLHSIGYTGPDPFAGKSVLVVGNGVSGMDIASDLAQVARKVSWSVRDRKLIVPRMFGYTPNDCSSTLVSRTLAKEQSAARILEQWRRSIPEHVEGLEATGLMPAFPLREKMLFVNERIVPLVRDGKVAVRPVVSRIAGRSCFFSDGSEEQVDVIVFATGYEKPAYTFLREDLSVLYKGQFHPTLRNIAFLGRKPASLSVIPTLELEARWFAAVLTGSASLPTAEEMRASATDEIAQNDGTHEIFPEIDSAAQDIEIAGRIGAFPAPATDWPLYWELVNLPRFPAMFRLVGPNPWPGAADYIREVKKKAYVSSRPEGAGRVKARMLAALGRESLGRLAERGDITGEEHAAAAVLLGEPTARPSRASEVEEYLKSAIGGLLGIDEARIEVGDSLSEYGFDSITLVQLARRVGKRFPSVRLETSVFLEYPTITALRDYIATALSAEPSEAPPLRREAKRANGVESQDARPVPGASAIGERAGAPPRAPAPPSATSVTAVGATKGDPGGRESIAIIGIGARLPGSSDLAEFWEHLVEGRSLFTEVPANRWDWRAIYGDAQSSENKTDCRFGAFLDDVECFDPLLFGISPREADEMDPQQRIMLETVWETLENAAVSFDQLKGRRVGCFVGVQRSENLHALMESGRVLGPFSNTGNTHSMLANRISYFFDWKGPSFAIDTACSSSSYAIHQAIRAIQAGDCEMAVAGGVTVVLDSYSFVANRKMGLLTADREVRSFDRKADGHLIGEGCGMLLLKPLAQAQRDGDFIYGVIRGSAVNQNGRGVFLTAPDARAHEAVVRDALRDANLPAASLSYIEAQGTANPLTDKAELLAFRGVLQGEGRTVKARVGSVKGNIGHLESASGVVAVIKVLLALQNRVLPGVTHFEELNWNGEELPFEIATGVTPWPGEGAARRVAGVHNFGYGGANAHIILEEAPASPASAESAPGPVVVGLSAQSPAQLAAYAGRLSKYLADRRYSRLGLSEIRVEDVAHSLAVGRREMPHRAAIVAESVDGLVAALRACAEGTAHARVFLGEIGARTAMRDVGSGERSPEAAARAWVAGNQPLPAVAGRRVPLVNYPFARKHFPVIHPQRSVRGESREDRLLSAQGGLERLNEICGYLVFALFQRHGLSVAAPVKVEDLKRRLRLQPKFERLFSELTRMVVGAGFARLEGDAIAPEPIARSSAFASSLAKAADDLERHGSAFPQLAPHVELVGRCAARLESVLAGESPATAVLFPESSFELVEPLYRGNGVADHYNRLVADRLESDVAERLSRPNARVRILEIGAGTGGTSEMLFPRLLPWKDRIDYAYTDVSPAFTQLGKEKFGEKYPFAAFRTLDIERPISAQGFEGASWDVVLATNVLHATRDIRATIHNVKELLSGAATLILNEASRTQAYLTLTFGLLDGWWRFEDAALRSPGGPLLGVDTWKQLLADVGLNAVSSDEVTDARTGQAVLVACPIRPVEPQTVGAGAKRVAPAAARAQMEAVRAIVAQAVALRAEDIRTDEPFTTYGVNSLLSVEIVKAMNRRFSSNLRATELFNYPTVAALADHLAAKSAPDGEAGHGGFDEEVPVPDGRRDDATVTLLRAATGKGIASVARSPREGGAVERTTSRSPAARDEKIAIVGISGRFPGAENVRSFWANLVAGKDCVSEVPRARWDVDAVFHASRTNPNTTTGRWLGSLDKVYAFDPAFFGISPVEAARMDPQQRLFLQEAWRAFEDAGYSDRRLSGLQCGVYVGCKEGDYRREIPARDAYAAMGNSSAMLASRISYLLNLKGPSLAIDTACSSSLVAVHLACEALRSGQVEIALAGGVSILCTEDMHIALSSAGMLSPTGRCRTFDDAADGFVPGEAVAAVVLKPLARALADDDFIYGVIAGSGINQDGKTNGITASSAPSQAALQRSVHSRFAIDVNEIEYVEAHGTGTALGDPIELQALGEAYGNGSVSRTVGSVKTNIGHTLAAAGIVGLIKAVLCISEKSLVPSLHYDAPNRHVDWEAQPFAVSREFRPWEPASGKRVAAVSAFGFAGTNGYVVVEESPSSRTYRAADASSADGWGLAEEQPHLVAFSAKTASALRRQQEAFLALLRDGSRQPALRDIAYTLLAGRSHFPVSGAFVVSSVAELVCSLETLLETAQDTKVQTSANYVTRAPGTAESGEASRPKFVEYLYSELESSSGRSRGEILTALADLFCAGANLDATKLIAGGRYLPLPGYAFDEHNYRGNGNRASAAVVAVASATRESPAESDWRLVSRGADGIVLETSVTAADRILAGHRVSGELVAPMGAFIEWINGVCAVVFEGRAVAVSSLSLLRPLVVGEGGVTVRVSVTGRGAERDLAIATVAVEKTVTHATLRVGPAPRDVSAVPVDIEALRRDLRRRVDLGEIAARAAEVGVVSQKREMVSIASVVTDESRALGRLDQIPSSGQSSARERIDGELVNAAFDILCALGPDVRTGVRTLDIPRSIGRIDHYRAGAKASWIVVERREEGRVDIQVVDEDGNPIITFDDVRTASLVVASPAASLPASSPTTMTFERELPTSPELARFEAGYEQLESYIRGEILRYFQQRGLFRTGKGETREELGRTLGVVASSRRLLEGMVRLLVMTDVLEERGEVTILSRLPAPPPTADEIRNAYPDLAPFVALATRCLERLNDVMTGAMKATEVLFPDSSMDLVKPIYRGNPAADHYNELLVRAVKRFVADLAGRGGNGPLRILEIGAGTGGTSARLLQALRAQAGKLQYVYTDVSRGFTEHGRRTYGPTYPFAEFKVLDIEADPSAQGFELGRFDVVVATNVLHATRNLSRTLRHARSLMKEGACLFLNEATTLEAFATMTFGLLDGWWLFEDEADRQASSPLPTLKQWDRLLRSQRFEPIDRLGEGRSAGPGQIVIVASATAGSPPDRKRPVLTNVALVRDAIIAGLASTIGTTPASDAQAFAEIGVDSIIGASFVASLNEALSLRLRPTVLFEYPTVSTLSKHIVEEHPSVSRLAPPAAVTERASDAGAGETRAPAKGESEPVVATHAPAPAATRGADRREENGDVAIIGMSGRFPGARDAEEFWKNIAERRCSITEVPEDRMALGWGTDPLLKAHGRGSIGKAGFLTDIENFDAKFFRMSAKEAELCEPQQRLFLEECWRALESAGYAGAGLEGSRCGVFAGVAAGDYLWKLLAAGAVGEPQAFWGNSAAVVSGRVAYFLNVVGPNEAIDTACSSSLVAIHNACKSLARGECEMAIAGGVFVCATPSYHLLAKSAGMLSPDGTCRAFDDDANGFVFGEGVGAVILKPLAAALRDRDTVLGIVKGSAVNHDGRTNGVTSPSVRSQAEVELEAYAQGGIDPSTITYVEAHGTGTPLGDPIEVEALTRAFRRFTEKRQFCALGSVKTNIGHATTAAGIAGVLKILLALRERALPPSLNFQRDNRQIDFASTPFVVNTQLRPWDSPSGPRRAAISGFGMGGTNCHLVLEEAPSQHYTEDGAVAGPWLVVLSGETPRALAENRERLMRYLARTKGAVRLGDVAFTLLAGRRHLSMRSAYVVRDLDELLDALSGSGAQESSRVALDLTDGDSIAACMGAARRGGVEALQTLASLFRQGGELDWSKVHAGSGCRRIPLPTSALDPQRYWFAGEVKPPVPVEALVSAAQEETLLFETRWAARPMAEPTSAARSRPGATLLVCDAGDEARLLEDELRGRDVTVVRPDECTGNDLDALLERLPALTAVLDVASGGEVLAPFYRLAALARALTSSPRRKETRIVVSHLRGEATPERLALGAAAKSISKERSGLAVRAVAFDATSVAERVRLLGREAGDTGPSSDVLYRRGERNERTIEVIPALGAGGWKRGGTYLVTGGAGGIGLVLARSLAQRDARVILCGRTPAAKVRQQLGSLGGGARISYEQVDVTRAEEVRRVVATILDRDGGLNGVLHCAGVVEDNYLQRKPVESMTRVLAPKVGGLGNLDEATAHVSLDYFVAFSSLTGAVGNGGQVDYAFANAFMDAFMVRRADRVRAGTRSGKSLSVAWPLWAEGGMQPSPEWQQLVRLESGLCPMPSQVGLDVLASLVAGGPPHALVAHGDGAVLRQYFRAAFAAEKKTVATPSVSASPVAAPSVLAADRNEPGLEKAIMNRVKAALAAVLGFPVEQVDALERFDHLGVDSLMVKAFNVRMERELGTPLPKTLLFEYPHLRALVDHLLAHHGPLFVQSSEERPVDRSEDKAPSFVRSPEKSAATFDVAIVGMAGRYPRAATIDQLWSNLKAGVDCVTEIPESRGWNVANLYDPRPERSLEGKIYCRWGAFLDDIERFDASFFRISALEARRMDPQERVFLEVAWSALEDAGYSPAELRAHLAGSGRPDVGVFVGVTTNTYQLLGPDQWRAGNHAIPGSLPWSIANRVSFACDFRGPSLSIDTACSSSLVAIHTAYESLRRGECSVAIVGGVNVYTHPSKYVGMCQMRMLSPTGHCHTFGQGDGFVPGEGVGAFVLKPLTDALADGDAIYAVVKGSAVNHNGLTNGYHVPNPASQAALVGQALRTAGVSPATIGCVEAHGTGTALGDPIELDGLARVYGVGTTERNACSIGSIKTNLGHLEAAAGVAGVTKLVLQLANRTLVPSLLFTAMNEDIDFSTGPFRLQRDLEAWEAGGGAPRRGAISSFGAGGTNAHVIVEEFVSTVAEQPVSDQEEVVILSARTVSALRRRAFDLCEHLRKTPRVALRDVAHTLRVGREPMPHRLAVRVRTIGALIGELQSFANGKASSVRTSHVTSKAVSGAGENPPAAARTAMEEAWLAGEQVDWTALERGRRVHLPAYPFEGQKYWISDSVSPAIPEAQAALERAAQSFRFLDELGVYHLTSLFRGLGIPRGWREPRELAESFGIDPKYGAWLRAALDFLAREGWVQRDGDRYSFEERAISEDLAAWAAALHEGKREHAGCKSYFALLEACFARCALVLKGQLPATDVLFPAGSLELVEGIYRDNDVVNYFNGVVADVVASYVPKSDLAGRPLRILEVGAGTGGTSACVIERLASAEKKASYHFTDLSTGFLEDARARFRKYPFVTFGTFDVSRGGDLQGLADGSFDVVIATNVLHATEDIQATIRNCAALLRKGGLFVVNEATTLHSFATLTFGLTDGWWLGTDRELRIPNSPLLDAPTWTRVLEANGFASVATRQGARDVGQTVFVSHRTDAKVVTSAATVERGPSTTTPLVRGASPRTSAEDVPVVLTSTIADCVREVLAEGDKSFDGDAPFSDFGVDSLTGARIIALVNTRLSVDLKSTDIFNYPTIEKLAQHIQRTSTERTEVHGREEAPPGGSRRDAGPLPTNGAPEAAERAARAANGAADGHGEQRKPNVAPATNGHASEESARELLSMLRRIQSRELSVEEAHRSLRRDEN